MCALLSGPGLLLLPVMLSSCGLDVIGTEAPAAPPETTVEPPVSTIPAPAGHSASCTETAADADVTLYAGHDPARPWSAHCGANHETYLRLGNQNSFSSYPAASCATGAPSVRTTWSLVRIDPVTFIVTTNDYTGAVSVGRTQEVSNNGQLTATYDQMPFGSGRTCSVGSRSTVAVIDLSATRLTIATDQAFLVEGFMSDGAGERAMRGASLAVQGFPGGIHPCSGGDYYQDTGGACLRLVYEP